MDEALGRHITDYLIKPVNASQVFLACKRVFDAQKLQDTQRARDYVGEMQRWQGLDLRRLDWPGWVDLAQDVARWDVRFDGVADAGLRQAHADFRRSLNIDFGRYVEEHYPHWVRGAARTARRSRPTWWRARSCRTCRPGGACSSSSSTACAWTSGSRSSRCSRSSSRSSATTTARSCRPPRPTRATPSSRACCRRSCKQQHPDLWQEGTDDERTKNRFERQLLEAQLTRLMPGQEKPVKYIKIYDQNEALATRRQINSFSGLPLVSMVFNFLDILAHGRSESDILQELAPDEAAFRAVTKAWFVHSPLYDIFRALSTQDVTVVLTTDHGAVLGRRAALVYGNRDTSTNLRYKFGVNLNCDPKQAVIIRRPMDYMLPDDGVNKNYVLAREDYYFVYPTRFHEFERQYRGSFQHGGISVEEMILPLVTLTPRTP